MFLFLVFVQMMWFTLFATGITAISNPDKFIALLDSKIRELSYDNTVRIDTPEIQAMQDLYDVKNHDLALTFDVQEKELTGIMIMDAQSLTDTLNRVYLNLYDNMHIDNVTIDGETTSFERKDNYLIVNSRGLINKFDEFKLEVSYHGQPQNGGFDSFAF